MVKLNSILFSENMCNCRGQILTLKIIIGDIRILSS
jgi:hypothetical protein